MLAIIGVKVDINICIVFSYGKERCLQTTRSLSANLIPEIL